MMAFAELNTVFARSSSVADAIMRRVLAALPVLAYDVTSRKRYPEGMLTQ